MQAVSGAAASVAGIAAALCCFAVALMLCSVGFLPPRRLEPRVADQGGPILL